MVARCEPFCGIVRGANHETAASGLGGTFPATLVGKAVELSGRVVIYETTPQIEITRADQVGMLIHSPLDTASEFQGRGW